MNYPVYIGTMNVVGELNSFDFNKNIDIFNVKSNNYTNDHIWPISRNGSKKQINSQTITNFSNFEKGRKVSGYVNDVRFAILQSKVDEDGRIIGSMYVSYDQGVKWYLVKNI